MYQRRGTKTRRRLQQFRIACQDRRIAAYVEALRREPAPEPPAGVSMMDFLYALAAEKGDA